jgi:hypothetical protein
MASRKRGFLTLKADKKLVLRFYVMQGLILLMFSIVLYDSFIYQIPFYYVCFLLLGLAIGRTVSLIVRIKHCTEKDNFRIETSVYSLVITLALLSVRFLWGRHLLEYLNVLWATDALYLIFVGVYFAKRRSLVRQMDEIVYGWIGGEKDV